MIEIKSLFLFAFFLITSIGFGQDDIKIKERDTIIVVSRSIGKCSYLTDDFYSATGLIKGHVHSAYYYKNLNSDALESIPIDDNTFNYNYYRKYYGNQKSEKIMVKLIIDNYFLDGKTYSVLNHIE